MVSMLSVIVAFIFFTFTLARLFTFGTEARLS